MAAFRATHRGSPQGKFLAFFIGGVGDLRVHGFIYTRTTIAVSIIIYDPSGRNQSEIESDEIDIELRVLLKQLNIRFEEIAGDSHAPTTVSERVLEILKK